MGDLRMAKVRHGEEKKVGKVQSLAALSYVPKTGYTLQSTRNPVLVEELRPRFPQAPPLNIRVCAERLPTGREAKGKKVPKTGLVKGSVVIKTYGTLRCHPITHEANTWLTARGVQDLPAQMRFDETYVQHMKNLGLERGRFVNASFAEWLFGFPQGFTLREDSECRPSKCRRLSKSCPLSTSKISAASVFSGCDGLSRGLEDWITVCNYCEVNPVPRELLENKIKRGLLAPAEVESDIREMDGKKLRKQGVRMIVGGLPCQDISISGNMVGFEGQRSSFFTSLLELLKRVAFRGSFLRMWRPSCASPWMVYSPRCFRPSTTKDTPHGTCAFAGMRLGALCTDDGGSCWRSTRPPMSKSCAALSLRHPRTRSGRKRCRSHGIWHQSRP